MSISSAQLVVAIAKSYIGTTKRSAKHKQIVSTFNTVKPHGEVASVSDYWCAEFWTAVQIMAGNTQKEVPMSYNCPKIIADAKDLGIWQENENVVPKIGWGVLYDWDDGKNYAKYDNKNSPDHIGIIYAVDSKYMYVVEGNKGTASVCGTRAVAINGRFLRGFVKPNYTALKKVTYIPTTAYSGKLPTTDIQYGASGSHVKLLQQFLNWCLGYKLAVDGSCGRATTQAIIDFQFAYGLTTDGSFGPACRGKAQAIVKAHSGAVVSKPVVAPKPVQDTKPALKTWQKNVVAWDKKIAADDSLHYLRWDNDDAKTHKCPICSGEDDVSAPKSTVKKGSKGEDVKTLQKFLNWCINAGLKVDGDCGDKTVKAIKTFQKTYGLTVDGSFGPKCISKAKVLLDKYHGWNCIGFAFAGWHHGGGIPCKCGNGVLNDSLWNELLTCSDAEALKIVQQRTGLKDVKVIRNNKNTIPQNKLEAADICANYNGNTYKHTFSYIGDGQMADCTSGKTQISIRSAITCKVAIRYTGK